MPNISKTTSLALFILVLLFNLKLHSKEQDTIRILTWWDYISAPVASSLKEKGYRIESGIYHSNDVAISRLSRNKENYDLAIISNPVIKIFNQKEEFNSSITKDIIRNRKYYNFLLSESAPCIPYLWSSTVFIYKNVPPNSRYDNLHQFLGLDRKLFHIGVIDDSHEVFNRSARDSKESCGKVLYTGSTKEVLENCKHKIELDSFNFRKEEFISSNEKLFKNKRVAFYGWHGSANMAISEINAIEFKSPAKGTIYGLDAICVLNKKQSPTKLKKIKDFLLELTSKKNTLQNSKAFQYFSPYVDQNEGLHKKIRKLKEKVILEIHKGNGHPLGHTSHEEYKKIQEWWRNVRFR